MKLIGQKVGIEDMGILIPKYFVDAGELVTKRAEEKKFPPEEAIEKIRKLGIEKFSVFYQTDVVQAGVQAILELMERADLKPKEISRIYTATETSKDEAKPLGTFLIGELEKQGYNFEHVETRESKFACLAGSYDLYDCWNYVVLHPERKVIVLCVDEAKYDLKSAAEVTQGAGAIASLLSANPSLVTLDFSIVGVFTTDVMDLRRPPGKETPIVNKWLSIYAYLHTMREAYDDYKRKKGEEMILERLRWLLFHNPYGLMVEDLVSYLLIHTYRDSQIWGELLEQIGMEEPAKSGLEAYSDEKARKDHNEFRKRFRETKFFQDFFQKKVEPSVIVSRETGNLFNGSLLLQLASLTTFGKPRRGDEIGFGGFGCGCGALAYRGKFENILDFKLEKRLEKRKKLEIEEYDRWRNSKKEEKILSSSFFD